MWTPSTAISMLLAITMLLAACMLLAYTIWFIRFELLKHGLSKLLKNKFVVTITCMSALCTIANVFECVYWFSFVVRPITGSAAAHNNRLAMLWEVYCLTANGGLHVYLLYLRSLGLLQLSPRKKVVLQVFMCIVPPTALAAMVMFPLYLFTGLDGNVYTAVLFVSILSFALMDIFTAVEFTLFLRNQRKMQTSEMFKSNSDKTTEIIAYSSLQIALLNLVSIITMIILQLNIIVASLSTVISFLWIRMKIRLEKNADENQLAATQNSFRKNDVDVAPTVVQSS
eukprot:TRINITY_DN1342_c0_g1_i2.p1 TRINITY_DN1342_c0_g1~~TRINITY_DN1342_c0_g1_i2.p1  ORF type:complete len:304 (+),score=54.00 TRINITY_DN1342_c0_g1_i2:63-914(+)